MSEEQCRGARDFTRYDSMATEELEKILRLDAEAPMEHESDTELILYVMEVLAKRKNKSNTGKTAQESWESFQKHYLPQDAGHRGHTTKAATNGKTPQPWLRRLIACAAAIILVLCIPLTTNAFGWEDVLNLIARWGKETFAFYSSEDTDNSEPSPNYDGEYTSLQNLLKRNKINSDIVPAWIPDGFVLTKCEKDVTPTQQVYIAYYTNDDKNLMIQVQSYISSDPYNVEIEDGVIEIYEVSGVKYYIFSNISQLCFVWTVDSYECNVSGDISIDDAKKMIDSIGKG
ncbi:MAG: DUF4367 domain-containing protein [Faecousia sp.]